MPSARSSVGSVSVTGTVVGRAVAFGTSSTNNSVAPSLPSAVVSTWLDPPTPERPRNHRHEKRAPDEITHGNLRGLGVSAATVIGRIMRAREPGPRRRSELYAMKELAENPDSASQIRPTGSNARSRVPTRFDAPATVTSTATRAMVALRSLDRSHTTVSDLYHGVIAGARRPVGRSCGCEPLISSSKVAGNPTRRLSWRSHVSLRSTVSVATGLRR